MPPRRLAAKESYGRVPENHIVAQQRAEALIMPLQVLK